MKKPVFFSTILVAGILTVGIAQYPSAKNNTSFEQTLTEVSKLSNRPLTDTVPKKDTTDKKDSASFKF